MPSAGSPVDGHCILVGSLSSAFGYKDHRIKKILLIVSKTVMIISEKYRYMKHLTFLNNVQLIL